MTLEICLDEYGEEKNFLLPSEFEPWNVYLVTSLYTDYASLSDLLYFIRRRK